MTVTAKIGKFPLTLSPMEPGDTEAMLAAQAELIAALVQSKSPLDENWLRCLENTLGFVFAAARKNHPDLSYADLCDDAEAGEVLAAQAKLLDLTNAHLRDQIAARRSA